MKLAFALSLLAAATQAAESNLEACTSGRAPVSIENQLPPGDVDQGDHSICGSYTSRYLVAAMFKSETGTAVKFSAPALTCHYLRTLKGEALSFRRDRALGKNKYATGDLRFTGGSDSGDVLRAFQATARSTTAVKDTPANAKTLLRTLDTIDAGIRSGAIKTEKQICTAVDKGLARCEMIPTRTLNFDALKKAQVRSLTAAYESQTALVGLQRFYRQAGWTDPPPFRRTDDPALVRCYKESASLRRSILAYLCRNVVIEAGVSLFGRMLVQQERPEYFVDALTAPEAETAEHMLTLVGFEPGTKPGEGQFVFKNTWGLKGRRLKISESEACRMNQVTVLLGPKAQQRLKIATLKDWEFAPGDEAAAAEAAPAPSEPLPH